MTTETLWIIVLGCSAATFAWRLLGVAVVRKINPEGAIFRWITCVSYAMVAGLVFRMLMMPESELASVSLAIRFGAVAIAFAAYFLFSRRLVAGVVAGGLSLSALVHWFS
ncbi:MAG: AzlD domain-containing protein [Gammaproteobacteria bacterium]|nr:AzlD domain-containing protein [Gammaproteobacteria bacterium]